MPTWLSVLLEIVKVTLPALIVFLTVYYLFKTYLEGQQQLRRIELQREQKSTALPLRMQAYERLSLFCERISLPALLLRFPAQDQQQAREYKLLLLMAIQQEYEHNITQQVYISEQLWEIIKIARDDAVNFITLVAEKVAADAPAHELNRALLQWEESRQSTGLQTALLAIKKEAAVHL